VRVHIQEEGEANSILRSVKHIIADKIERVDGKMWLVLQMSDSTAARDIKGVQNIGQLQYEFLYPVRAEAYRRQNTSRFARIIN
ncbi:hypothetical protein PFISCL1PPCAC_5385, partial [Pristionchus fissidentatus]